MARVAVVTGGTRGIGEAISKALKAAGYNVAATYAGNDEAANKFKAETGINVYKFDVSDYDACAAGIAAIEKDLGPVEVLVNNAGITKDRLFHKMDLAQWSAVINTNLSSLFNVTRQVINDGDSSLGHPGDILNSQEIMADLNHRMAQDLWPVCEDADFVASSCLIDSDGLAFGKHAENARGLLLCRWV